MNSGAVKNGKGRWTERTRDRVVGPCNPAYCSLRPQDRKLNPNPNPKTPTPNDMPDPKADTIHATERNIVISQPEPGNVPRANLSGHSPLHTSPILVNGHQRTATSWLFLRPCAPISRLNSLPFPAGP